MSRRIEKTSKLCAVALATYVCLATVVVARGSEGRSAVVTARATTAVESFCGELQRQISAQRMRFSGWRCKQGPSIRGRQTILAWVNLTRSGGETHLALIWLAETRPVVDAPVIDVVEVPHYGYEPSNVQHAFAIGGV
jgi:hypothetical protein